MRLLQPLLLSAIIVTIVSCSNPRAFDVTNTLGELPIIPMPTEVVSDSSYHVLGTFNIVSAEAPEFPTATLNASWTAVASATEQSTINLVSDSNLAEEAYRLDIKQEGITITAAGNTGWYWGWQTLQQVLTFGVKETAYGKAIPTGTITDQPTYGYRGMMLDIARHYFNLEEIKQVIDEITLYKINRLHLHLADDQGWRIEIKSWPKLTEIGGTTEVGGGEAGFLTQDDYKELIRYAAERNIMIIPEIDMPGHTNAALASYAELNCDNKARELYTGIEVGFSTFCTDKEVVYEFIADVVREISELTPGPYFHIGGDESHSTEHEDYLKFVNRVLGIVSDQGKVFVGWDEVAQANVNDQSVIQLWHHQDIATQGLEKGATVLFSLAQKTYLDMKYDSTTELGLKWAGYIDIPTSYNWDPTDFIDEKYADQFLGVEAALWSETVTNIDEVEYMMFPRLSAYAEIGWTPKGQRNWEGYQARIRKHANWWQDLSIDAYQF